MDFDQINKDKIKFDEKENSIEKIPYEEKNEFLKLAGFTNCHCSIPLKKITKRNCETDENKFSIKYLKTHFGYISIGLTNSNFKEWDSKGVGNSWEFNGFSGSKYFKGKGEDFLNKFPGLEEGDIVGLKYNSIKGEIEIFINNESVGIMFDGIDINQDYLFVVTLYDLGDKIQILQ